MSYVLKLIEEGEHQHQDFKMRIDNSRKIAKTLVAFANASGGRLLIGVKDNGSVVGVNVDEEIHMIDAAANMYSDPPVEYKAQIWQHEYKKVLEITVLPSDTRPHLAEIEKDVWECFTRIEDKIMKANGVQQKVWRNERKTHQGEFEYDKEKEKLFKYLNRRGSASFVTVSKITKLNFPLTEELLSNLISWGVLEMKYDKNKYVYAIKDSEKLG